MGLSPQQRLNAAAREILDVLGARHARDVIEELRKAAYAAGVVVHTETVTPPAPAREAAR